MTDGDKYLAIRTCLVNVATCPSCHDRVKNVLAKIDKEDEVAEPKDNDDIRFWFAVYDLNKELELNEPLPQDIIDRFKVYYAPTRIQENNNNGK